MNVTREKTAFDCLLFVYQPKWVESLFPHSHVVHYLSFVCRVSCQLLVYLQSPATNIKSLKVFKKLQTSISDAR